MFSFSLVVMKIIEYSGRETYFWVSQVIGTFTIFLLTLQLNEMHPHSPHISPHTVVADEVSKLKHWCIPISPNAMITTNSAIGPSPPVTTFCYHVATKRHIANKIHVAIPLHFLDSPPHPPTFLKKYRCSSSCREQYSYIDYAPPHLPVPQHV